MDSLAHWNVLTPIICLWVVGFLVSRRLVYHPLRRFPGPKLAALTTLYKGYYELVRGGELLQHLVELHAIYGPVVRIAPNELHFNDHTAYFDIYRAGSPFTKEPGFYKCFGADTSAFGAIDPRDSKVRREVLNPLFSRRVILRLENLVQAKVDKLISRLAESRGQTPINMFLAFRCTTMDIITSYCFAHCVDALDAKDFYDPLTVTIQATVSFFWVIKSFSFVIPTLLALPARLASSLHPQFRAFIDLRKLISVQVDNILKDEELTGAMEVDTIYHHLLNPRTQLERGAVPSRRALLDEALSLIQAGSDTVGHACTVGVFHALNDKVICKKIHEELCEIWPDKDSQVNYTTLEKLPYLTAVLKESLRLAHGIVTPLPRVVGPTDTIIGGFCVPTGTVVGTGATFLHLNSNVFHEPQLFSPERWLQPNSKGLHKHLVPFSKGPRMCLGINLAWCELYLIFGNIFRRLDLEIYNTTADDFSRFKEFFVPIYQGRQFHAIAKGKPL